MARPGTPLTRRCVLLSSAAMTSDSTSRDDTLVLLVSLVVMIATLGALVARSVWGV